MDLYSGFYYMCVIENIQAPWGNTKDSDKIVTNHMGDLV